MREMLDLQVFLGLVRAVSGVVALISLAAIVAFVFLKNPVKPAVSVGLASSLVFLASSYARNLLKHLKD